MKSRSPTRRAVPALVALVLMLVGTPPLRAETSAAVTEVAGVRFDNTVQLGNAKLLLNGAGVRYKVVFKVYAAALYLGAKAATTEAVLAMPGPRRLQVVMLRDIDANELGRLFTRGMEDNVSREDFAKCIAGILKMSDIFSARRKLVAGDSFSVDWRPGAGTSISVNGRPVGEPIQEPEFNSALMKIWLGKSPADRLLKDALLGKPAPTERRDAD